MDRKELLAREKLKYEKVHLDKGYGARTARGKWFKADSDEFHLKIKKALKKSQTFLDVGCAKGFFMDMFKRDYPQLVMKGLDISENAKKSRPDLDITVAHAGEMPFHNEIFDFVAHMDGMEHIPEELEREVMDEILRVSYRWMYFTIATHTVKRDKKYIDKGLGAVHINMKTFEQWEEIFKKFAEEKNLIIHGCRMDIYKCWVHIFLEKRR